MHVFVCGVDGGAFSFLFISLFPLFFSFFFCMLGFVIFRYHKEGSRSTKRGGIWIDILLMIKSSSISPRPNNTSLDGSKHKLAPNYCKFY